MRTNLRGHGTDAETLRDLGKGESVEPVELDHAPVFFGELGERPGERAVRLERVVGARRRSAVVGGAAENLGTAPPTSKVFPLEIEGNRVEPGFEALFRIEVQTRAVELQERLLYEVTRLFAGVELAQHQSLELFCIALEELLERRPIASGVREHQFLVRPHVSGSIGDSAARVG